MRNPKLIECRTSLNILSLNHLSKQIGIPKEEIIDIFNNIEKNYVVSEIAQEKPAGKIKTRKIYHPSKRLKIILININKFLLRKIILPASVHGSRKKHSTRTNAEIHVGKRYLLGFDIANFFPSIKPDNVLNIFRRLKCTPIVAKYLTGLCTADDHVPQGYNTSPLVANLVLVPAIERLQGLSKKHGLSLGTFVDDICISGNDDPSKYKKTIEKIINECGFTLKSDKTISMGRNQQQKVTGIVVNVKPNIDKKTFQELKKIIHICQKFGPSTMLEKIKNKEGSPIDTSEKLRNHLSGRINYVNQLNPTKAEKLKEKFNGIIW